MVHTSPSHWSLFLGFVKVGRRWPGSLRVGTAAIVPCLAGVTAFGQSAPAAITALGAFATVYGEGRRGRAALRGVSVAAVLLVLCAAFGSSVGSVVHAKADCGDSSLWWLLMLGPMTAIAVIGASVVGWLKMGPPGIFLPLLTVVISSTLPDAGVAITSVVGWTAAGAITAVMMSMSDWLFRRRFPQRSEPATVSVALSANLSPTSLRHGSHGEEGSCAPYQLRSATIRYLLFRALHRDDRERVISLRLLFSCLISGLIALGLGIDRPDWAVITAAMILHLGPDRVYGTYRGMHRLVGTIAGLCVVLWLAPLHFDGSGLAVVVALLIVGMQLFWFATMRSRWCSLRRSPFCSAASATWTISSMPSVPVCRKPLLVWPLQSRSSGACGPLGYPASDSPPSPIHLRVHLACLCRGHPQPQRGGTHRGTVLKSCLDRSRCQNFNITLFDTVRSRAARNAVSASRTSKVCVSIGVRSVPAERRLTASVTSSKKRNEPR